MLKTLIERWRQGHRTMRWPDGPPPEMPDRFRGWPILHAARCGPSCEACVAACPHGACAIRKGRIEIDLGRCLFCGACQAACPSGAIEFTSDYRLAVSRRERLMVHGEARHPARALDLASRRLFGRSLRLRQVSAGGCNACEADCNVLGTLAWDLGRFGIQFVASPRHADGLLITGPVPENMRLALEKTWKAVPAPRIVVAVGACAISGGPYVDHPEVHNGAAFGVPVDLFVPGCPPHPLTILDGLLRLLGRIPEQHEGWSLTD